MTPYGLQPFRLQQPPGARKEPIAVSNLDKVQDLMPDPEYVMKDFHGPETQLRQDENLAPSELPPANCSFEPSSSKHSIDLRARVEHALRDAWNFDPVACSTSAARQNNHGGLLGFTPEEYRYLIRLKFPRAHAEKNESQTSIEEAKEKHSWQISPPEDGELMNLDDKMIHQQIDNFYGPSPEDVEMKVTESQQADERFNEGSTIATTWLSLPERGIVLNPPSSSRCDALPFIDSGIYMDGNYEETPKPDNSPNNVTLPFEFDPENESEHDLPIHPTINVNLGIPRERSAKSGLRLFGDSNEIAWDERQEAPYDLASFVSSGNSPIGRSDRAEPDLGHWERAQEVFDSPRAPVAFMSDFQDITERIQETFDGPRAPVAFMSEFQHPTSISVPPQPSILIQNPGKTPDAAQAHSSTGQSPIHLGVGSKPYPSRSMVLPELQHTPNQGIFGSMATLNSPRIINIGSSVKSLTDTLSRPKSTRIGSMRCDSLATPPVANGTLQHNSKCDDVPGDCVSSSPTNTATGRQTVTDRDLSVNCSHPGSQSGSNIDLDGLNADSPAASTETPATPQLEEVSLIPSPILTNNADIEINNKDSFSTLIPTQKQQPLSTIPSSPSTPQPSTPKTNTVKTTPFQATTPYYIPAPSSSTNSPTPAPRARKTPTKQPLPHSFPTSPKKHLHNSVKNVFRSPKLTTRDPDREKSHRNPTPTGADAQQPTSRIPAPAPVPQNQIAQAVLLHPPSKHTIRRDERAMSEQVPKKGVASGRVEKSSASGGKKRARKSEGGGPGVGERLG